jgi:uncharacterized membrane protein
MEHSANLWAVAYDDTAKAEETRARITLLAEQGSLKVLDTALGIRHRDGVVTLEGEPLGTESRAHWSSVARFLAGLMLAVPPLTGGASGRMLHTAGLRCPTEIGIDEDFIREVVAVMKPGVSVLFVLDQAGDMDAILQGLHGLGGQVLKTNVNLEHATRIQQALAAKV